MEPNVETPTIAGDNVSAIYAHANVRGYVVLTQSDNTVILAIKLEEGETFFWFNDSSVANPVMGDNPVAGVTIGKVKFSQAGTVAAKNACDIFWD